MLLTKLGHACVRLSKDDRTLVIDPGALTPEDDAFAGADAVLITHEHFDHFEGDRLRRAMAADPRLEVWTCRPVADGLSDLGGRVHVTGHGDAVTVAGFEVHVYGEKHEVVHPDVPPVDNIGFLVEGEVFHPGDAFTIPDVTLPTLCLPTNAPWMKSLDMYAYLREIEPRRAYSVHDGLLNDVGLSLVDGQLSGEAKRSGADIRRLRDGESVEL
ncbi:MBL fold metallo-hydrolase [Actinomadura sp. HBU206391]|uniref:MBL fold metallo-hydrolase n=1 Tax=Actinomadura sp. HBU206391 TaxID=2731692 RepID=UPI00164FD0FA|nr:MBL fold metallo-hydrolase [Actinomadura sp. HBU206391]MBC6461331.1 MBL fold metallo-hydrolase [Actinomadura sp. HBU206391]